MTRKLTPDYERLGNRVVPPITQEYMDQHVVTVCCNARGVNRKEWMLEMIKWADENNITLNRWLGDSSHVVGDKYWHEVKFAIEDPIEKTFFLLRWG